jgi:CRP-like cAMP-binding protein
MQPLIHHLQLSGQFTAHEIDQIQTGLIHRTLQKGELFSEPARPSIEMAFVGKGILRVFSPTQAGQESTHYFIDENNFVVTGSETSGNEHIQAVMRTDLILFSWQIMQQNTSFTPPEWQHFSDYITHRASAERTQQIGISQAGDATARYKKFMEEYPQIAGRVPLSFLASYLGITQQSLSRIRKQLTKKSPPRET